MTERPASLDHLLAFIAANLPHEETTQEQPETCDQCRTPFDPADARFNGRARFSITPFCRRCVDRCHEATDATHQCAVCC